MPSSHSSTVSALAVAIGLQEGFGASVFAVALILACIVWSPYSFYAYHSDSSCCKFPGTILRKKKWWQVMYDATGVRLHAGRQAEVICFFVLYL